MLPLYYENDPHKDWKMQIEMFLVYLSFFVIMSSFILVAQSNPGYCHDEDEKKITQKSFEKLMRLSKEANTFKGEHKLETFDKKYDKKVKPILDEFKDNYGYSLYCKKCEIYRYPRTHH